MIRKILKGYKDLLLSVFKVISVFIICAICGCALVLPLWKFAVSNPELYSIFVCVAALVLLLFFITKKTKNYITQGKPEKKEQNRRIAKLLITLFKFVLILLGIIGFIAGVLWAMPTLSLVSIIVTIVLYGILAFGTKKDAKKS